MPRYVPGVGTFDPDLPDWLIMDRDGKLYNINADANSLRLVEPWSPPDGWRGAEDVRFTPDGEPPAPPPPAAGEVSAPPVGPSPVLMHRLLTAMRAMIAHENEMLASARQRMSEDTARMQEGLRLAQDANTAFDAVLADIQSKVNPQ